MTTQQLLFLEPKILGSLLIGLVKSHFTGTIQVDTQKGVKRIFFKKGQIVFASSNMIDDRLGEVMYRAGMISIDQMTDSAVKVNRNTKFGKVLLINKILSSVELWRALKLQVMEILRSIFLAPGVQISIESGVMKAPTTVVFERGSEILLEECAGFGRMYRMFLARTNENCKFLVNQDAWDLRGIQAGTFVADLLEMSAGSGSLRDVVEASKLQETTAYTAIFRLMNLGVCRLSGLSHGDLPQQGGGMSSVKAQIDAYGLLIRSVQELFKQENMTLPIHELHQFVGALNGVENPVFFVDELGQLPRESILNIFNWCLDSDHCTRQISLHLDSLIHFLMQISGDLLPLLKVATIKSTFNEMI